MGLRIGRMIIMDKKINNKSVDEEILAKGKNVIEDFDDAEGMYVTPKPLQNKLISIRLPMVMINTLRVVAQIKGDIGYQQLIKTYIAEGLNRDQQRIIYSQYVVVMGNSLGSSSLVEEFPKESSISESCITKIS